MGRRAGDVAQHEAVLHGPRHHADEPGGGSVLGGALDELGGAGEVADRGVVARQRELVAEGGVVAGGARQQPRADDDGGAEAVRPLGDRGALVARRVAGARLAEPRAGRADPPPCAPEASSPTPTAADGRA